MGFLQKLQILKKEQSKSELYETVKIEYLNLKTKAIEEGRQDPPISEVLSTTNFLSKYNVDGGNITDKKGEVIDTEENLLESLKGLTKNNNTYPKTVSGVTITEDDKDKMILKVKIKENNEKFVVPGTRSRSYGR